VQKKSFGITASGKPVDLYVLTNSKGATVEIMNYGATITRLLVPDKTGKLGDVVLGFDSIAGYQKDSPYFGTIAGRVANRIAKGTFTVDGVTYHVAINNGPNSLHGGLVGYDKRIWNAAITPVKDGQAVTFTLVDPDGTENYPGTVNVAVKYTLTDSNTLRIDYTATTDKATPINLTNHTYWNLKDAGVSDIGAHILQVNADAYTPVDDVQIPTGEIAPVKGTPIDFTSPKPIGKDIEAMSGDPAGYDHNLVLRSQNGTLAEALKVYEPTTGRVMEMWTTEPGVQFYTANFLAGKFAGKGGVVYQKHSALCFEAQDFPDAINHPNFPSCILRPGETYHQTTEYRFSTSTTPPQ
jgi:aldose 1-epimerase